jgi:hypothetical protein
MSQKPQPQDKKASPLKQAAAAPVIRKDYQSVPDKDKSRFLLWMVSNRNGVKLYRYSRWQGELDHNVDFDKEIRRLLIIAADHMGYFDQCIFYRNLRKGQFRNDNLPPNEEMFLITPACEIFYANTPIYQDPQSRTYLAYWQKYIETWKPHLLACLKHNQEEMRRKGLLGPKVEGAPAKPVPGAPATPTRKAV